jgi:hypothetical protein
MGYSIIAAEHWEVWRRDHPGWEGGPDLRLVDDHCWQDVPSAEEAPEPIIVLTGRHGATGEDPREAGALMRPAGLHDLYRLLQTVLEESPRSTPRVPTHIRARCEREGREWQASVLSLSENGCLLRSSEKLTLGSRLQLTFSLPQVGEIATEADVAYQMLPDVGLVFNATPSADREAIVDFVSQALAS